MKILYIASIRLPTEKAHGIQIMKTCEAFSQIGQELTLIVPNYSNSIKSDPFEYYGVKRNFIVKKVFGLRLIYLGKIGFFIETFIFFISVLFTKEFWSTDFVYTRDEILSAGSIVLGKKTIWETHVGSFNFFSKIGLGYSKIIVAISKGLKDYYVSKGFKDSKIIVSHDGVSLEDFDILESKKELRQKFSLPIDKKIILYAGRLDGWKGVQTLFKASESFSRDKYLVVVGGDESQIKYFSKKYPSVLFLGYKPYILLPLYQKLADVLIIPNTGKNDVSKFFTSPMKLFSYMASGVPIVASDLPSIREILTSDSNSLLFVPDSSESLLMAINRVLEDDALADIIAKQALLDVQKYTWLERVKTIISNI